MDWDDDEVETKLRDELREPATPPPPAASAPPPPPPPLGRASATSGAPSPFPTPSRPAPSGNVYGAGAPSPFGATPPVGGSILPPAPDRPVEDLGDAWDDDEAVTRVMPSISAAEAPGLAPAPVPSVAPVTRTLPPETMVGDDMRERRGGGLWIGLAVAAAAMLGLAYGGKDLIRGDDPATITLVTSPADAEVVVDGRPLTGQTSPFTVQGLAPEVAHQVEIRKDGYEPNHMTFSLLSGEVKALESIELKPLSSETGFALTSDPSGASVFVDGKKLDVKTPTRITDLEPGLHTIRLEHGDGYQPWQTQIALASGQVIELPTAGLTPGGETGKRAVAAKRDDEPKKIARRDKRRSRRSSGASSSTRKRASKSSKKVARASSSRSSSARSTSGGQGTLRINSRPWSQVYVDGRLIGNTPQLNIKLSPGRHKVKLVNPDMGMTKRFRVKVQAGKATTKIVDLM